MPYWETLTPSTQATLRFSFYAPTRTLSTWYRQKGSSVWEQLGDESFDLDNTNSQSLGYGWGLSESSTLRVALWAASDATNGSAGQDIHLDNFSATLASGTIFPGLTNLTRRAGQPLFLSVSPRDVGAFTYSWKRNGTNLPPVPALSAILGTTNHIGTYYLP